MDNFFYFVYFLRLLFFAINFGEDTRKSWFPFFCVNGTNKKKQQRPLTLECISVRVFFGMGLKHMNGTRKKNRFHKRYKNAPWNWISYKKVNVGWIFCLLLFSLLIRMVFFLYHLWKIVVYVFQLRCEAENLHATNHLYLLNCWTLFWFSPEMKRRKKRAL